MIKVPGGHCLSSNMIITKVHHRCVLKNIKFIYKFYIFKLKKYLVFRYKLKKAITQMSSPLFFSNSMPFNNVSNLLFS